MAEEKVVFHLFKHQLSTQKKKKQIKTFLKHTSSLGFENHWFAKPWCCKMLAFNSKISASSEIQVSQWFWHRPWPSAISRHRAPIHQLVLPASRASSAQLIINWWTITFLYLSDSYNTDFYFWVLLFISQMLFFEKRKWWEPICKRMIWLFLMFALAISTSFPSQVHKELC